MSDNTALVSNMLRAIDAQINICMTQENIESYLKIVALFPQFDYRNHILIWMQNKDAHCLASKLAYEEDDATVNDPTKQILLIYPNIGVTQEGIEFSDNNGEIMVDKKTGAPIYEQAPLFSLSNDVGPYYDISNTQSNDNMKARYSDITKNIEYQLGCMEKRTGCKITHTTSLDDEEYIRIDPEKCAIFIQDNISPSEYQDRDLAFMDSYIDFKFLSEDERPYNNIIQNCLRHILRVIFAQPSDIPLRSISNQYMQLSDADKHIFLREISNDSQILASELINNLMLTFNEIMIANKFFQRPDPTDILWYSHLLLSKNDNEQIRYDCDMLFQKLTMMSRQEGYLETIVKKVSDKKLYTYPRLSINYDI